MDAGDLEERGRDWSCPWTEDSGDAGRLIFAKQRLRFLPKVPGIVGSTNTNTMKDPPPVVEGRQGVEEERKENNNKKAVCSEMGSALFI